MLLFDIFEFVVLCVEHMDISYNSRISKMVKGIINNRTGHAAGVEDGMVGVLDTWTIEIRGRVGLCMKGGAVDGFVLALSSLMDGPIID